MKCLFVFELGRMPVEWQMPELVEAVQSEKPELSVRYFHSPIKNYYPGGLHPLRIFSLLWMHLCLPFVVFLYRPDWIFVRTSPPLIQWTALLLGRLTGARVGCWLMDYHPLIECRLFDRYKLTRPLARSFDRVDRWILKEFNLIVCLDQAMLGLCRERVPKSNLIQYPTWGKGVENQFAANEEDSSQSKKHTASPLPDFSKSINFAYIGNLGKGHSLEMFEVFLKKIKENTQAISLYYAGGDEVADSTFRSLSKSLNIAYKPLGHIPFPMLGNLYTQHQIHYGIVLMKDAMAGLISPSKYTGYIHHGLPILYIGPKGTNAEEVVSRFGGGVAIRNSADDNVRSKAATELLISTHYQQFLLGAQKAKQHFASKGARGLAKILIREMG